MQSLPWIIMGTLVAASGVATYQIWRAFEAAKAKLEAAITEKNATIQGKQAEIDVWVATTKHNDAETAAKNATIESLRERIELLRREVGKDALDTQKRIADTYRDQATLATNKIEDLQGELDAARTTKEEEVATRVAELESAHEQEVADRDARIRELERSIAEARKTMEEYEKAARAVDDVRQSELNRALGGAASRGDLTSARKLVADGADVNAADAHGWTALHEAALRGRLDVVRWLVEEAGANVDSPDLSGCTVLHAAARGGHFEVLRYLVEEVGLDVRRADNHGRRVQDYAAELGHLAMLRHLVEQQEADVTTAMPNGWVPLHGAAYHNRTEVVQYLVQECGANVNAADAQGRTALYWAKNDEMRALLRELGAKEADREASP